jgi:hypothetical protein
LLGPEIQKEQAGVVSLPKSGVPMQLPVVCVC